MNRTFRNIALVLCGPKSSSTKPHLFKLKVCLLQALQSVSVEIVLIETKLGFLFKKRATERTGNAQSKLSSAFRRKLKEKQKKKMPLPTFLSGFFKSKVEKHLQILLPFLIKHCS